VRLTGIWVPLITPFHRSRVDASSLERLVETLIPKGISGLVAAATTGEAPLLSEEEHVRVARIVKELARARVPVFAGAGGADTKKTVESVKRLTETGVDGILAVAPYYVRPDQRGLLAHFEEVAASTSLPIVLYNIPYRTGVSIKNETIRQLARIENIIGLKDCSGDYRQSMELLLDPPEDFSILTGEDAYLYSMLALGADGGILASAHWATESFVDICRAAQKNDFREARSIWGKLAPVVPLFFDEPNPAPVKYLLHKSGTIASGEVRLPLVAPSRGLAERLDALL
jgi:4-hydroxy-tetrahydrodipicolinate synthase